MEIRFLGPFDVVDADRPISLGGRRQRAACDLALRPGRSCPSGRLIDDLWPEGPPDSALNTLQAYVSRLRKALRGMPADARRDDHLRARGLRARHLGGQVDSDRFERLIEVGEHHARAGDAEKACDCLAARRSRSGAGRRSPTSPTSRSHRSRSRASRSCGSAAIEARIDAELRAGVMRPLVAELEALVQEHPHREGFRRQLMLALYRSGRQGEALRRLHGHAGDARRGPRHRADAGASRAPARDPPPGPGARNCAACRCDDRPVGQAVNVSGSGRRSRSGGASARGGRDLLRPSHGAAAVHVVRNSVAVVDAETNRVVDDVVVGDYPGPIAAGNGSVWVGNIGDSTVTEIHGDTRDAEFPASAQRPVDLAVTDMRSGSRMRPIRDAAADGRRNSRASRLDAAASR